MSQFKTIASPQKMEGKLQKVPVQLAREYKSLSKEVKDLRSALDEKTEELDEIWKQLRELQLKKETNFLNEEGALIEKEKLEERVRLVKELSTLVFTRIKETITEQGKDRIKKKFEIGGLFDDQVQFELEFETTEIWEKTINKSEMEVTSLAASLPEAILEDIGEALQRVMDECSMHGFFRLATSYIEEHEKRSYLFEYFHEKYPDSVAIMEPDSIVISLPHCKHGPIFTISWELKETLLDKVQSVIRLGVEASNALVNLDITEALKAAPEQFGIVLRQHGPEKAIQIYVDLLNNFDNF